jgi:hypothetical protein
MLIKWRILLLVAMCCMLQVLDWLSFGKTSVKDAVVQQLRITAAYYVVGEHLP